MRNLWISIGLILLSSFLFYDTFSIEGTEESIIGPAEWPRLLTILLFVFGIIMFIQSMKELKKITTERNDQQDNLWKYWLLLLIAILYIPATLFVGFIIATPLVIAALSFIIGMRNIIQLVFVPLIGTVVIVYIFIVLLQISMPRGIGIFKDFSLFFY